MSTTCARIRCALAVVMPLALIPTAPAGASPSVPAASLMRCAAVTHSVGRLQCFDALVQGMRSMKSAAGIATRPVVPPFIHELASFERSRPRGDHRFRMLGADQYPGQRKVLISAPAINQVAPRSLLTISCIDNISRLQLVVYPPLEQHQALVAISVDGAPGPALQSWQVLGDGLLVDAGRGLAAIEVIRRLEGATELQLSSDASQIDGLRFNASGLSPMILMQRQACRW